LSVSKTRIAWARNRFYIYSIHKLVRDGGTDGWTDGLTKGHVENIMCPARLDAYSTMFAVDIPFMSFYDAEHVLFATAKFHIHFLGEREERDEMRGKVGEERGKGWEVYREAGNGNAQK